MNNPTSLRDLIATRRLNEFRAASRDHRLALLRQWTDEAATPPRHRLDTRFLRIITPRPEDRI